MCFLCKAQKCKCAPQAWVRANGTRVPLAGLHGSEGVNVSHMYGKLEMHAQQQCVRSRHVQTYVC